MIVTFQIQTLLQRSIFRKIKAVERCAEAWQRYAAQARPKTYADIVEKGRFY
jgi:hypothetical protein